MIANRRGVCVDCGAEVVRLPGQPGQLPKRCDPCWVENKQRTAEEARLRAMADPERAPKYRERGREQVARWRADNPERSKARDRASQKRRWDNPDTRLRMKSLRAEKKYGLGPGGYRALLDAQDHACAICGAPFNADYQLAVDHDHRCCDFKTSCGGCVRGLLCTNCNRGLAAFFDVPDRMRAAADYVEGRGGTGSSSSSGA